MKPLHLFTLSEQMKTLKLKHCTIQLDLEEVLKRAEIELDQHSENLPETLEEIILLMKGQEETVGGSYAYVSRTLKVCVM